MSGRTRHHHKNRQATLHIYAYLDVHKTYSEAVGMEKDGMVDEGESLESSPEKMERFSDNLPPGTDTTTLS